MDRALGSHGISASLIFWSGVLGQTAFAPMKGTVTDPSGAVVPAAKVAAASETEAVSRQMLTGNTGDFAAPNLNVGRYRMRVEEGGFAMQQRSGIILSANQVFMPNVFNHSNFALTAADISSPATVGTITSTVPATFGTVAPREADFQLRLEF